MSFTRTIINASLSKDTNHTCNASQYPCCKRTSPITLKSPFLVSFSSSHRRSIHLLCCCSSFDACHHLSDCRYGLCIIMEVYITKLVHSSFTLISLKSPSSKYQRVRFILHATTAAIFNHICCSFPTSPWRMFVVCCTLVLISEKKVPLWAQIRNSLMHS